MAAMSDVLLRVGRLNYVWTNTESLLIYIIAHLLRVEKDAAIVVFLTLNTTRARIDLIERLSKLASTSPSDRKAILSAMSRLKKNPRHATSTITASIPSTKRERSRARS